MRPLNKLQTRECEILLEKVEALPEDASFCSGTVQSDNWRETAMHKALCARNTHWTNLTLAALLRNGLRIEISG